MLSPPQIAFVVATKDRPADLRKMLQSLSDQSKRPDQVVIVDSSMESAETVIDQFSGLNIKYIRHPRPSASAQRNKGIGSVNADIDLIGFLDDDIVFEKGAIEKMLKFWEEAPEDVGGCAFNLKNPMRSHGSALKFSSFAEWLGIYSKSKGIVMSSGWQTLTGTVSETMFVQWLPTTASVWRRDVFEQFQFDEYFNGYSYLEDLDFSLSVSKKYRLAVLAEAGFYHFPSLSGRISWYHFGKIEVANRLYIVRKHQLSVSRCYLGLFFRFLMTLGSCFTGAGPAILKRAAGNCAGLIRCLLVLPS